MDLNNFTNTRDLLSALADSMNLIDPDIEDHHRQTAYLLSMMARHLGLSEKSVELTVYAGPTTTAYPRKRPWRFLKKTQTGAKSARILPRCCLITTTS